MSQIKHNIDSSAEWIRKNKINEIECIFPDLTGSAKGKLLPANKYLKEQGFRLPESMFYQTVTGDTPEYDKVIVASEGDMILKPDFETLGFVPWAIEPTAQFIHDCYTHGGELVDFAPRTVLKKVIKLFEKKGLKPIIAPEMEFYLTKVEPSEHNPLQAPIGRFQRPEIGGHAYGMDSLNDFDPLLERIYQYCDLQNIEIDALNHEFGTAQIEINFRHGDPLSLADQVFNFKRITREVAIQHNLYATFMAKPMEDQPGSSMHIHQSIVDKKTGENIFVDEQGKYSDNFYHYIAGLQKYIIPAIAIYCPNVNSYRRIIPDHSAPVNIEWGVDNRTTGLRVPLSEPQSTRVENRIAGADTNPYLTIAASLAAGYLGMEENMKPRPPIKNDAYELSRDLPLSLEAALNEFEIVSPLHHLLGKSFIHVYKEVKKCELDAFSKVISSWERKYLLLSV